MSQEIVAEQVVAWISWGLAAVSNIRYGFGHRSPWDHGHQHDVAFTPFTANFPLILVFWTITIVSQGVFLSTAFARTPSKIVNHYIANNVLLLLWSYLFSRAHYFLAEIVIILTFLNATVTYILHKSYSIRPLRDWLVIHVSAVVLPLTWSLYVIFWNGAVLFHAKEWPSRLVANILIWDFLVIPVFFLLVFGDWALGLFNAWITLAIGVGQLFTKVFALQWIFAFSISGMLTFFSVIVAVQRPFSSALEEEAPLLNA